MSLESLLTKVDESIWKQYEKVTNWAYNNYGWSKYDLAMGGDIFSGICFTGYGTYLTLLGIGSSDSVLTVCGASSLLIGGSSLISARKNYDQLEKSETNLALSGVAEEPKFGTKRPYLMLWSTAIALSTASLSYSGYVQEHYGGTLEQLHLLTRLMGALFLGHGLSIVSADYFSSQLPKPPKAKKSVWQAVSEPIAKYFRKAVPLPEPKPEATNS